jgi:hypothetical protein
MPYRYCPGCGGEFQKWVQVCPVCGAALVDELPKQPPSASKARTPGREDPLVFIASAPNEPLAMMWAGILENKGIRCVVKSRDLKAAMYVPSLLSISEIHVLGSEAERARQVLAPFREGKQSLGNGKAVKLE